MSGRLVAEVLDNAPSDLSNGDLLVLIALAEDARDRDRTARGRSSSVAIAARVRSSPSSVRNALVRLRNRGLIRPTRGQVHRGHQQNWIITELSEHHRDATVRIAPTLNGAAGKRHPEVTRPFLRSVTGE